MALVAAGLFLFASVTHSFGQATRNITLEEAVELSLKNSKQL